jgi:site-specific DNA recombinase
VDLWDAVQAEFAASVSSRPRPTDDLQHALLRGLITDPHGRPTVQIHGSSKVKSHVYYETRNDLARPGNPPGLRFQRGHLEQHLMDHLETCSMTGTPYAG